MKTVLVVVLIVLSFSTDKVLANDLFQGFLNGMADQHVANSKSKRQNQMQNELMDYEFALKEHSRRMDHKLRMAPYEDVKTLRGNLQELATQIRIIEEYLATQK